MKIVLACVGLALAASISQAASKPLQISITPDVALFDRSTLIEGLSLSLWGENPQKAVALGLVNGSVGDSAGLSWAFLLNYADDYTGVQWAPVNFTKGDFVGWQAGLVNYADGTMKGFQSGVVNYAGTLTGLQFGFINYAENAKSGVQLGLVNLIPSNEWFTDLPDELAPGMVFVNWHF